MSSARRTTDDSSPKAFGTGGSPASSSFRVPRDDVGSPLSPVPASPSEAVLSRCRDTIRRLHAEIEDERNKRLELQHKLRASEARALSFV